jgi:hypothetical protein
MAESGACLLNPACDCVRALTTGDTRFEGMGRPPQSASCPLEGCRRSARPRRRSPDTRRSWGTWPQARSPSAPGPFRALVRSRAPMNSAMLASQHPLRAPAAAGNRRFRGSLSSMLAVSGTQQRYSHACGYARRSVRRGKCPVADGLGGDGHPTGARCARRCASFARVCYTSASLR